MRAAGARLARFSASTQCAASVAADLRNLRRAGVCEYRSSTSTVVPTGPAAGVISPLALALSMHEADAAPSVRLVMRTLATDAIDASASPRKPSVSTRSSSASVAILLVAWRVNASASSAGAMPWPSSLTTMRRTPPSSMRSVIRPAPASIALSSSSRTTEAGRSTTSPAAIWLTRRSGSSAIGRAGATGAGMRGL
jgi:hypothetical protein